MRRLLVACLLVLAWAEAAPAQSPPRRAQDWTNAYMTTCRTYGGRGSIQPGYQTSADLNGDGRPDYIMDMRRIACSSREGAAAMCSGPPGTCTLFVYLSTATGHADPPQQFEVRGWTLDQAANPPALVLQLPEGERRYAWNGSALAQGGAPPARPAPPSAPPPPAAAQVAAAPPAGQPPPVAAATQQLMASCRGFGGRPGFLAEFQTIMDLNADGQPDYILDVERVNCEGAASALCAGVGCQVMVFASSAQGYRDVSPGDFAKGWDIDVTTRPPTLLLRLDTAACGAGARAPCTRAYQWNGTTLAQAGSAAPPPPAAPAQRPAVVTRAQNELMASCRESGGRPSLVQGFQTTVDLNGDGQPDYILDATNLNCEGAASALCGSAGCPLQVFLSGPRGYAAAFGSNVQGWEVEQGNPPVLRTDLHGSFCGRVGSETCVKRYAWNGSQFAELRGSARPTAPPAASAEGSSKLEPARPGPAPASAWELRETSGNPAVATAPGPGVIQSLSLLCFRGVPVAAFSLRAAPPPGKTIVTFSFSGGRVDLGIAPQQGGGRNLYYGDLRGTTLPRLLAGSDSQVPIRINGGQQGTLSLAGSSSVVRQALADCYRF